MADMSFIRTDRPRRGFRPVIRFVRATSLLVRAYERYRQRQALAKLDERLLADIGLGRADVARECAKSWWPV